jgi:GcrA cell cycle regulator
MTSKVTESEQKILRLWEEGLSGKAIAEQIGVTRNAVMGKLHRLRERHVLSYRNMATRMAAIKRKVRDEERAKEAAQGVPIERIEEQLPTIFVEELAPLILKEITPPSTTRKPVKFMDLQPSSCRYVVSGVMVKDFLFCNEVKKVGSPYCQEHHAICNMPNVIIKKKVVKNDVTA